MLPACALVDPQGLVFLKMFNLFDMYHWYLFGLESLQNLIFADLISLCRLMSGSYSASQSVQQQQQKTAFQCLLVLYRPFQAFLTSAERGKRNKPHCFVVRVF